MKVAEEKERPYNYSKLRGRTVEMAVRDKDVAVACGMAPSTYSQKLNGKGEFTQNEICNICQFLQIETDDIPLYFFT